MAAAFAGILFITGLQVICASYIKECTNKERRLLKQCVFKFLEESVEVVDDMRTNYVHNHFITQLLASTRDCRRFWMLVTCARSVEPCSDNLVEDYQRAEIDAAVAFKYAQCSNGFQSNRSLAIVKCLDNFQRNPTCGRQAAAIQTPETCQVNGAEYIECIIARVRENPCELEDLNDYTIVCQLYSFRQTVSCRSHNCVKISFVELRSQTGRRSPQIFLLLLFVTLFKR